MKKYLHHIFFSCLWVVTFYLSGCKKAENIKGSDVKPEKELTDVERIPPTPLNPNPPLQRIKVVHLYKDTVYTMSNFFVRQAGEQLVIDAGTVIKTYPGSDKTITINPGGVIIANGTPENPIVFTSGSNTGNQNINWGGIILQGNSNDNSNNPNGDPADFSGSLNYVRIEFAGLILTGVGNGTAIENVQVSYAHPQASFEIDGGTFNARNLISYACGGPADFYFTRGYTGKMQNLFAYRHPFFGATTFNPPNALAGVFIENSPSDPAATPNTNPIISNLTVLGPNAQNGSASAYADTNIRAAALVTTANALFHIRNSLFLGFPEGAWNLDDMQTAQSVQYGPAELTYSFFHSNDSTRIFYLKPDAYPPYTSETFRDFVMASSFNNQIVYSVNDLMFSDPFNYDDPDPFPKELSSVLQGANFDGTNFNDAFFNRVSHKGALGTENWFQGWTNFTPLKTNYNFSK